jgi:outer membrane protein OmpA-like peptidoglycan-associated protein
MGKGQYIKMITAIGIGIMLLTGCGVSMDRLLGRDIAERRNNQGDETCPQITTFTVSPVTVQCGGQVSLEIAATSPVAQQLTYTWDIEGQTFEVGQRAVWKTPTSRTIGDPEKTFTVRGVVSDGQCSVTRSVEVTILCSSAFDAMVHFAFAKSDLDATAKAELDEIGKKLQQSPGQNVLIDGHTDYIGTNQNNMRLGQRRAEAAKNYLMKTWHISSDRFITRSFGEEQPIAPNETDPGRAQNRRAEMFRVLLSTKQ